MTITKNILIETPKGSNSVLVCGLPGSGFVGKIGADYLISVLNAMKIAEYRCNTFPPQVNVKEDGTVEPPKAELYFAKAENGKGVMIFTADAQPADPTDEYVLCDKVVKLAKKAGAREVYALAAYITGYFPSVPKVYGAATDRKMLAKLVEQGVTAMNEGAITGMNGLVIGIASLYKMKAACLLGETSGYVLDASASLSVLEALSRLTGITFDMTKIRNRAEETKKLVNQLQKLAERGREQPQEAGRERRPGYIS
jgi:uncharacterized protein (TIGR00162 family)